MNSGYSRGGNFQPNSQRVYSANGSGCDSQESLAPLIPRDPSDLQRSMAALRISGASQQDPPQYRSPQQSAYPPPNRAPPLQAISLQGIPRVPSQQASTVISVQSGPPPSIFSNKQATLQSKEAEDGYARYIQHSRDCSKNWAAQASQKLRSEQHSGRKGPRDYFIQCSTSCKRGTAFGKYGMLTRLDYGLQILETVRPPDAADWEQVAGTVEGFDFRIRDPRSEVTVTGDFNKKENHDFTKARFEHLLDQLRLSDRDTTRIDMLPCQYRPRSGPTFVQTMSRMQTARWACANAGYMEPVAKTESNSRSGRLVNRFIGNDKGKGKD